MSSLYERSLWSVSARVVRRSAVENIRAHRRHLVYFNLALSYPLRSLRSSYHSAFFICFFFPPLSQSLLKYRIFFFFEENLDAFVVALVSLRKNQLSKITQSRFVCVCVYSHYLHPSRKRKWRLEAEGKVESTPVEHT